MPVTTISLCTLRMNNYMMVAHSPTHSLNKTYLNDFSLFSALWVMWGLLCGHLVAFKAPKSWPNKFLINVWGGFSVIFVASYTANIAALIAGLFFHNAAHNYDASVSDYSFILYDHYEFMGVRWSGHVCIALFNEHKLMDECLFIYKSIRTIKIKWNVYKEQNSNNIVTANINRPSHNNNSHSRYEIV